MVEEKFPIQHVSLRIFPAKSHKIILSTWYHLPYFVLFSPQNMDKSAPNNTRYPPFSGSGTLGDEIFHCIVRKELFELSIKLRCQSLVVGDNQCWFIQLLDDVCHRKSLSRTGDTQKCLTLVPFLETFDQLLNGLRLVTSGFVF